MKYEIELCIKGEIESSKGEENALAQFFNYAKRLLGSGLKDNPQDLEIEVKIK